MTAPTFERLLVPLPDISGRVHGIVSLDPPKVQCDGCGLVATGHDICLVALTCGIKFNPNAYEQGDRRRLCRECATTEWKDRT